ncbi:desulfoferrodoxin [Candidatus Daviesbacteria bacterium RIFOXYD1_FULL_41_10]|uniref:Desulfoferrodoxin n=2 Tax=Candidatus Daviesiibacteriota TaxID=1752718 RepID=A0A1F5N0A2_9BACT|nr:MAG: Desulfoferrodoxin [Candidatus Daviesbacteria bacterium GW2011_GWB1_41_5]OGE71045.1 MAG: desulfoferrodoxin [Candidatus Daviesbacteria bacterium RIFOXYD1_FULL_41_10]
MERGQIYRCKVCGHVIEILHPSEGQLVCCNEPMELLEAKTQDEGYEKHVPIIEKTESGVKVKVGSVPHPMEEAHYIEWIEVSFNGKSDKKFLKPGDVPEAEFNVWSGDLVARAYCNIHLLWKSG